MKTKCNMLKALHAGIAGMIIIIASPGQAQVTQMLYATPSSPARDNYTGAVGCEFQVGVSNVLVSHLGFFDFDNDGLTVSHNVAVFGSTLSSPTIRAQVSVPAGTVAYLTNGFRWVQLDPPLLLQSNTLYVLAGMVGNGDGDTWQDLFTPTWNTYFVGSTVTTTRNGIYGPGNATWPPTGLSQYGANQTYGNVSLGYIEVGNARVGVQTTNLAISAGQNLSVQGFATGQQPISYQWHLSGGTSVSGQTNAVLVISNAVVGNYTYYLTATNVLGGEQSANVTVTVTAIPVGIAQQPTNLTIYANYQASFFTTATGTPPISYQWSRNGINIPGATSANYSLTATSTNNGDVYSCLASNTVAGTPHTSASSNATLTVRANLSLPQQILHGVNTNLTQNGYSGTVGGQFTTGNSQVTVTHLGYYAPTNQFTDPSDCSLSVSHRVGIYNSSGTVLYTYVTVPAGTSPVVNGYIWQAMDTPFILATNTTYLLMAEVFNGSDPWGDTYFTTDLNSYFATSCAATYGSPWPTPGAYGKYSGQMYSAPNMAILAPSTPVAFVTPTSVTQYVDLNATLTAVANGQPPVLVQWYKEPGTMLGGQTNLTLNLNNLGLGDAGSYYVIATNPLTTAKSQSADAVVTVIPDVAPSITQDIYPQDVFVHQTVQFVAAATGTPPLSYQWMFNSNPISGATNSTLTLTDVSTSNTGNYQFIVTNKYSPYSASSSVASLTVEVPQWGSYSSAVMGTNLLLYYTFSDANSGFGIATNQGSLGFANNGTYDGGYSGVAGPTGPNSDANGLAVSLDGYSADVLVPPLTGLVVSNLTIAAWVYDTYPNSPTSGQTVWAPIFMQRSSSVFGLSVHPDPANNADELNYYWNGSSYWLDTFLDLPTNQWAFVAMVISPTNTAIYLHNGLSMQSTNFTSVNPPATFTGNSYIGWDTAGGSTGRRWNGPIGNVMVFNQALSTVAINALYLGVPASATIQIATAGNSRVLTWPGGTLVQATNLLGPWAPVTGAKSPYTNTSSSATKFFRVQLQ